MRDYINRYYSLRAEFQQLIGKATKDGLDSLYSRTMSLYNSIDNNEYRANLLDLLIGIEDELDRVEDPKYAIHLRRKKAKRTQYKPNENGILYEVVRNCILDAVKNTKTRKEAADLLGISVKGLQLKLKNYGF